MADNAVVVVSRHPDYRLVERLSRSVAGQDGAGVAYYAVSNALLDRGYYARLYLYRRFFFNREREEYELAGYAPYEEAVRFWSDFDHVLNTFKFLD
jgi:hypothetical protein